MKKAIIASLVTIFAGWFFTAVGLELMSDFDGLGTIMAVAIMGGFIIAFNERRK